MLERFFSYASLFLAIFLLTTFVAGHFDWLTLPVIVLAAVFSVLASFGLRPAVIGEPLPAQTRKILLGILLLFSIIVLLAMPEGIFLNTCSDVNNHARNVRLGVFFHSVFTNQLDIIDDGLFPLHETPTLWLGLFVALNTLVLETYPVIFYLSLVFQLLTIVAIFFIGRRLFDDHIALLSAFISAFVIVNFFLLQHGFIPQLVGTCFVLWAVYFFLRNDFVLTGILLAAGFSYPPFFFVFWLFLAFHFASDWFQTRKRPSASPYLVVIGLSVLLSAFEFYELLLGRLPGFLDRGGFELIRGGIAVPHPILLIVFLPALFELYHLIKQKPLHNPLFLFIAASAAGIAYIVGAFLLNFAVHAVSPQIHRLYMAVKFFYFLLLPLSILAAAGIVRLLRHNTRTVKLAMALLLVIHLLFFAGFMLALPPSHENFPAAVYRISDQLSTLSGPFFIGIDEELLVNEYKIGFPYAPFIDNPDDGPAKCPKIEINRLWEFPWANHQLDWDEAYFRAIDDQNNWVVQYGSQNVDYFVTTRILDYPVLLRDEDLFVYDLRASLENTT